MTRKEQPSMQEPSVISQAQNAVETAHRSVSSALSHPTSQLIEQAENSLAHTENAVEQARLRLGGQAVELAEDMLGEEKERLAKLKGNES
ncbi:hypothetical protein Q5741_06350 [Paenibacillus sp. JX-17]|uniref:DUF2564 family protein n=1 Tax=Paenibacillus lacisoli TaxID=3064525 RepID=A0ABT9CBK2_9BACL|nr:hypothetical protein [Paenibacillus sp. JX-17]MDO7906039.1 hypothetical protein [Paenibacillus sp. JX-17]